jgi:hypothetical protein
VARYIAASGGSIDLGGMPLAEERVVAHETEEEHEPRGTVVMMVLFLLIIIGVWVWTYATLLERAG